MSIIKFISNFFQIQILSLFFLNQTFSQFDGKLNGEMIETGLHLNDLHLNWNPIKKKSDQHSLDIREFKFQFSNIKLDTWLENKNNTTKINLSGPEISLTNLILNSKVTSPDWITEEKIKRLEKRQSIPKKAISTILDAINLYRTDHGKLPASLNELAINQYLDLGIPPFNDYSWSYILKLPESLIAHSTQINPIPKSKSIYYDFDTNVFLVDPKIDSLYKVPNLDWNYLFQIQNISTFFSSKIDISINPNLNEFSLGMKRGKFKIINTSFKATPLSQLNNQTRIHLPELLLELNDLMLNGTLSDLPIIYGGKGKFRIRNFEIKIPEGLSQEPEIQNFLETLGIWNNSLMVRLAEIDISMINEFTGGVSLKFQTPFLKINIDGDFSFRQNGSIPSIVLHNTQVKINPIAFGVKKWIYNWEQMNGKTFPRQGAVIILNIEGPISDLIIHNF